MWSYAAILTLGLVLQAQSSSPHPNAGLQVDVRARELAERLSALERSVRVELEKPLEAKKAKRGARVTAKLMENLEFNEAALVPRGAKIVGRVVDVRRTEGKSAVTLSFDRAVMEGSQRLLVATIKAVGAPFASLLGPLAVVADSITEWLPAGTGRALDSWPPGRQWVLRGVLCNVR